MTLSRRRSALVARLRRRRTREREGLFLVEGIRSAAEALDHGADLRFAVCSPRLRELAGGPELAGALGDAADWVEDDELAALSDTEAPQGVLLVCREPRWTLADLLPGDGPGAALVLDGVQDPGNVGTLVRAASAFGVRAVVALDGTVDPFNPKAVRAAAGALFRLRLVRASWADAGAWLHDAEVALLAADARGTDVAGVVPGARWALAIGNEGGGLRAELVASSRRRVAVPMPGPAESLNAGVAGSVLLYALTRTVSAASERPSYGSPELLDRKD